MSTPTATPPASPIQSTLGVSNFALYRRLLSYVRPYAAIFVGSVLCTLVAGLVDGFFVTYLGKLLEWLFETRDPRYTLLGPLGVVVIFLVSGVFGFLGGYGLQWVGNRVVHDLRVAMFSALTRAPAAVFDSSASGQLISKFAADVNQLQSASTHIITSVFRDGATLIYLLFLVMSMSWQLSLVVLLVLPPLAWVLRILGKRLRRLARDSQGASGGLISQLTEALSNQRVIKLFAGEARSIEQFSEASNHQRSLNTRHAAQAALGTPITQLLVASAIAAIIYLAVSGGTIQTVSAFTAFVIAIAALLKPLKALTSLNVVTNRGLAACESVFAIVDLAPEPNQGQKSLPRSRGEVQLESVSFRYPNAERNALSDVSWRCESGQTLALVGGSGGGKTTVTQLLARFYQPDSGSIKLDGIDLNDLTLASVRAQFAWVGQEVRLFDASVLENVRYANLTATEADIRAACHAAHALSFIEALPQGFATPIGENGVSLSGGQRQRIAIARAILKDAPILLLDEATSALDNESERAVQSALATLMQGRTTIVVAHRLSTIEHADTIVVLDQGRVVESGRHAALLAKNGLYARLYQLQFTA